MYNVILTVLFLLTAELAQKARREIADYVNNGKEERARIRVRIFMGLKSHLQILSYHVHWILKLIFLSIISLFLLEM